MRTSKPRACARSTRARYLGDDSTVSTPIVWYTSIEELSQTSTRWTAVRLAAVSSSDSPSAILTVSRSGLMIQTAPLHPAMSDFL